MSRVPAITLRTTCNTQNSPFIGASAYYFYDQLKINLGVQKAVQMLGKQLAFPTYNVKNRKSAAVPAVLQTALLPLSTLLRAKNFFCVQLLHSKHHFKNKIITGAKQLQPYTFFSNNTFQSANRIVVVPRAKNTTNAVELIKQLCFRPLTGLCNKPNKKRHVPITTWATGEPVYRSRREGRPDPDRVFFGAAVWNKTARLRSQIQHNRSNYYWSKTHYFNINTDLTACLNSNNRRMSKHKELRGVQKSNTIEQKYALFYENKKKGQIKATSQLTVKNLFVLTCIKNLNTKKLQAASRQKQGLIKNIDLISKPIVKSLAKEAYARLKTVLAKNGINDSLDLKAIACSSNVADTFKDQLHMQCFAVLNKMALKQQQTLKTCVSFAPEATKVGQLNQKRPWNKSARLQALDLSAKNTISVGLDNVPFTTALWAYPKLLICRTFNDITALHVFCLIQGRLNKSQWHKNRPNKALFASTTENSNKSNFWHNNVALIKSKNAVVFEMHISGPTDNMHIHGSAGKGTTNTKQALNCSSTGRNEGLILRKTVSIRL